MLIDTSKNTEVISDPDSIKQAMAEFFPTLSEANLKAHNAKSTSAATVS